MTFAEIADAYLHAPAVAVPAVAQTPARALRDALEPIATQGWWAKAVHDRLEAKGVGFLDGYVWGRAAALGEPAPSVVVATFGVFEPTFLIDRLQRARAAIDRAAVLHAREAGAVDSLSAVIEAARLDLSMLDDVADALLDATASQDGTARPLFSGLRELPLPASTAGRLWRGAELVREHRGDGHLAACIAAGLGPLEMSVLTELWLGYSIGEYSSTRGYGPDAVTAAHRSLARRGWAGPEGLTPAGRAARDEIEAATDRSQQALVDALGPQLGEVTAATAQLSETVVKAGAFPADGRKRAAG